MTQPPVTRLLLVPTQFEADKIRNLCDQMAPQWLEQRSFRIELVGFGPILSAARTVQLIAQFQPDEVVLMGIAGLYQTPLTDRLQLNVGDAISFDSVSCYGIGAGAGRHFQSAASMGWPQWKLEDGSEISETLSLGDVAADTPVTKRLLTVCSAAGAEDDVSLRLAAFPDAIGEDMEAFGVAAAAKLAGCGCRIIRGFSNVAGDREHANWQVDVALEAACQQLRET